MKTLPFKPFVYFQCENKQGKRFRYHIHVVFTIPNGFAVTRQPINYGSGKTDITYKISPDGVSTYTEPYYDYISILVADLQNDGGFFAKVDLPSAIARQFNMVSGADPTTNHDYDDADGFPVG